VQAIKQETRKKFILSPSQQQTFNFYFIRGKKKTKKFNTIYKRQVIYPPLFEDKENDFCLKKSFFFFYF